MPIVLCTFCEYIGSGNSIDQMWDDVRAHELKEHREIVKEEEGTEGASE